MKKLIIAAFLCVCASEARAAELPCGAITMERNPDGVGWQLTPCLMAWGPLSGTAPSTDGFPAAVSCRNAEQPLDQLPPIGYMGLHRGGIFTTADAGTLPQLPLVYLGLPLKYAMGQLEQEWCDREEYFIGTNSYPHTNTLIGDYNSTDVWLQTDAFRENFATPQAMVNFLRHTARLIEERESRQ